MNIYFYMSSYTKYIYKYMSVYTCLYNYINVHTIMKILQ